MEMFANGVWRLIRGRMLGYQLHNLFNFSSLNLLGCRLFFSLFLVIPESIIPNEILPPFH